MIIQFLWVGNSEAALIDGSGQKSFSTWFFKKHLYLFIWPSYVAFGRSLTRDWAPVAAVKAQNLNRLDCQGIPQKYFLMLQEICQLGCSCLKARLGLIDLFHSGWLTWCWLLGGGLSSFPHGPLQAPLSILMTWWLASPVWEFQEKAKHKSLCLYDLVMRITDCHFYIFLLVTQISYSLQESDIHKNVNIRKQGLLGHLEGWLQPPYPSAANMVLACSRHLMYVCSKNEQRVRAQANLELSGLVT